MLVMWLLRKVNGENLMAGLIDGHHPSYVLYSASTHRLQRGRKLVVKIGMT